jgi:Fe-S cluster assembly protein SufB
VEDRRRAALEVYESQEVPTWRRSGFWTTSLRGLDVDALEPKRYDSLDSAIVRDHLGDEEHAALIVQQGANVVHCDVTDERITVMPLEQAVEEHPELVEEHFAKRLPYEEGKFPAGTAAFWTGGVFVHVPAGVQIEKPIQAVWLIEEPGTVQWAHTLVVVGENAECKLREYFLAPDFEGQALHAGAFELYAKPGAQVHLAHYQDWGSGAFGTMWIRPS